MTSRLEGRAATSGGSIPQFDPDQPIMSVHSLAEHLWVAGKVELSTIPLYLYSAYSIKTKGYSQWAPGPGALRTLIGVAIEEMLHLCLVRNLMTAIGYGGRIKFYDKNFIPTYPHDMLNRYPNLCLALEPLSTDHVMTFVQLEAPDELTDATPHTTPEAQLRRIHPEKIGQYKSLGEFYRSIDEGFTLLDQEKEISWDSPKAEYQYLRGYWNKPYGAKPLQVRDLVTAKQALNIIIEQGEGSTSDHKSTPPHSNTPTREDDTDTHYERFIRIRNGLEGIGAVDGSPKDGLDIDSSNAVWPVVKNPTLEEHGKDNPKVDSLMRLFNAAYCYMLCILDEIYQHPMTDMCQKSVPDTKRMELYSYRYALERNGINAMQGILYPLADILVRTPLKAGGDPRKGPNAGPPFQYHEFGNEGTTNKKDELILLCDAATRNCPELGGDDNVSQRIRLLVDIDSKVVPNQA